MLLAGRYLNCWRTLRMLPRNFIYPLYSFIKSRLFCCKEKGRSSVVKLWFSNITKVRYMFNKTNNLCYVLDSVGLKKFRI